MVMQARSRNVASLALGMKRAEGWCRLLEKAVRPSLLHDGAQPAGRGADDGSDGGGRAAVAREAEDFDELENLNDGGGPQHRALFQLISHQRRVRVSND